MRRLLAGSLAVAAMAWPRPAVAGAERLPGIDLRWTAPSACPGADELRNRVRQLLGAGADAAAGERLVADAVIVADGGRYRLTLVVRQDGRSAGTTRILDSDSCESLAGAAAVTLAILARGGLAAKPAPVPSAAAPPEASPAAAATSTSLGPGGAPPPSAPPSSGASTAASSASSSTGASTAAPSAPANPTPSHPIGTSARSASSAPASAHEACAPSAPAIAQEAPGSPASAPSPAVRRWSILVVAPLLGVDDGVLPSWAFAFGAGAGVRVGRLRLLVTGAFWLPQSVSAGDASPYGADFTRWSGDLSGCYGWRVGPFEIDPCLTAAIENLSARGTGPAVAAEANGATWLALGAALRATWSPSRWADVFFGPSLALATSRPRFLIDGVGSVYRVPEVAGGVALGWEWIL